MATVTVNIPDNLFTLTANLEKAAASAVNTTVDSVAADFQSSVQHFNHKPTFTKERAHVTGDMVVGSVYTDDENYSRLNNGTVAHQVGQGGKWMSFYTRYTKKTAAGRIPSSPGGTDFSSLRVRARGPWTVRGINARNYDQLIADKNQPVLQSALDRALQTVK